MKSENEKKPSKGCDIVMQCDFYAVYGQDGDPYISKLVNLYCRDEPMSRVCFRRIVLNEKESMPLYDIGSHGKSVINIEFSI